ncbi:MAG TPA: S9 family peptidase [Ideonella sp.]|nr:S9 family peptidase [Ideonella sp.]
MLTLALVSPALAGAPTPPVAPKLPHTVTSPSGDREDEYYWLRDDDTKAKRPEVMRYLEAENDYAKRMLAPLAGLQAKLIAEMKARMREDDSSPPQYNNGYWYWTRFDKGAEYPRLIRRAGTPERMDPKARDQVVLDQPRLARGQPFYNLGGLDVSPDRRWLAWTEDTKGRRIHTLRFLEIATGRIQAEEVPGVLEAVVWAADDRSVFYILQDPVTLQSGAVKRHRVGTPVSEDTLVYDEPDKTLLTEIAPSASREQLLIHIDGYATTETRAVPLAKPESAPSVVLTRRPDVRSYADHLNGRWVIRTNEQALNYRLVEAPEAAPDDRARWKDLVPARDDAAIDNFALMQGGIVLEERVDAAKRLRVLPADGRAPFVVEGGGSAATMELLPNFDAKSPWLRYSVTSMTAPLATWDLNLATGQRALRKTMPVPGYDPRRYATERTWATARDGKRIPIVLAWRPDLVQKNGKAPLVVRGYGAYGIPSDPKFRVDRLPLLDRGFVMAIAQVRGGSELGQGWYEDGRLMRKQNSFNDFVDATRSLVAEGWGAKDKVFASGGSAGGLLMGAVANQAGTDYRGIALHVPFVDGVTTMLDESIPLTANEWTQWGDPRKQPDYDYILSYSPYDNIAAKPYPAMLVTTGLWDSQVQYYEPSKYVARLRAKKTDASPLLMDVNMSAGHHGATGRFQKLRDSALEQAFFLSLAGMAPALGADRK